MAQPPGVVTGRYGTLGEVFYVDVPYWPLNTTLYVRNFRDSDPYFVYLTLSRIDFASHSGKSGVPGVNRHDLHQQVVLIPPFESQRAIADAVRDAESLLTHLDQLIAKKEAVKQGAMQQLLTGQTRLPGFSGRWSLSSVGQLLRVRHGRTQKGIEVEGGEHPILASGGEIGRTNQHLHDKPSVLIGRKGTIDSPRYIDVPFWTVDTLFFTELGPSAEPKYVFYTFCLIDWRSYNEGSGVPSLNAATIESIELRVPCIAEQRAIAEVLTDMDDELEALKARRDKTQALKQGMMQELLSGRIRLV